MKTHLKINMANVPNITQSQNPIRWKSARTSDGKIIQTKTERSYFSDPECAMEATVYGEMDELKNGPFFWEKHELPAKRYSIPIKELNNLAMRYLSKIPKPFRGDRARIGFQVEKAYWEHINQFEAKMVLWMENNFKLKDFARQIFPLVPWLKNHVDIVGDIISDFYKYKSCVPVYGVIILNKTLDKVVLVRSFRGIKWGFPKGKINQNESEVSCAVREAEEEVGLNLESKINPENWCEEVINGRIIRLYIVQIISESKNLEPKTKFEIEEIKWAPLTEFLHMAQRDAAPFYKYIRSFVNEFRPHQKTPRKKQSSLELSSSSASDDIEEVHDEDQVHHDKHLLPEDFLPEAWKRFSLDHDYLLELSQGGV